MLIVIAPGFAWEVVMSSDDYTDTDAFLEATRNATVAALAAEARREPLPPYRVIREEEWAAALAAEAACLNALDGDA